MDKLKIFNDYFYQNTCWGDLTAPDVFTYRKGKTKVCFCAPHSVCSFVKKQEKKSDLWTGAIVRYMGERYHFSTIVRNKFVPRKDMISTFIMTHNLAHHFFLDIHGMKNRRDADLVIGTGYFDEEAYAPIMKIIKKLCDKYAIRYKVNLPDYIGQIGLTGRLQKELGAANVLQLEWSAKYRDIEKDFVKQKTIPFLHDLGMSIERSKFLDK